MLERVGVSGTQGSLEENLRRLPDEKLASLPPGERFIKRYIRRGPLYWYDPRFDSSPLWEGVEVNTDMTNYFFGRVLPDLDITGTRRV